MKKIYLRWKDENCNGINPEWIEMTGKQFLEFKRRPENKHRKFIECIDEYQDTATVVIEATQESYKKWHCEDVSRRRKIAEAIKTGYITMSMDEEIHGTDVDEMTLHDVVANETVDVEGEAIKYCEIRRLNEVLAKLSADELELIKEMYLSDTPLSERAYAERLGISSVAVHKRKTTVLKKIRKYF